MERQVSLKLARFFSGMSQWDVGIKCGLSQTQISQIENGTRRASPVERAKIAKAVNKKPGEINFIYLREEE
jgi:transcriptional regulator with XRE-family HTH domain